MSKTDLTGFSDDQIRGLYVQSQRGVRRHGYDDSDDVTVDYTPSAQDAIDANKVVSSDWKYGDWKDVREQVKQGLSEEDLIHHMRGAVASEFHKRQDARFEALEAGGGAGESRVKEAFTPEEKSAEHLEAEQSMAAPGSSSAVDSYTSAFDRAVAAGRDMTAGDYLRQRSDDKKSGVGRFTHFLRDSNTLAAHEGNRAAGTAIKRAEYEQLDPPQLIDPGDLYDRYKGDIDDI